MAPPRIAPWAAVCWSVACVAVRGSEGEPESDIVWQIPVSGNVNASAVMDWHGRLYFGTANDSAQEPAGVLYCVDSEEGEVLWTRDFPDWLVAAPTVTQTRVYLACNDSRLYCLDKFTGGELWAHDTFDRVDSTPAVDSQGRLYFGSRDRWMRCLEPDGAERWSTFLFGPVAASPIIDERMGRLYISDLSNTVYGLNLSDGQEMWRYKPRQTSIEGVRLRMYSSPALDDYGLLYVGSGDFHVYAVNSANGQLFWKEPTDGIVDSSPVISLDGALYIANRAGRLIALNTFPEASERVLWDADVGQVFYGCPVIDALGNIYICGAPPVPPLGNPKTRLSYVEGSSGEVLWSVEVDGYTDATPFIDGKGNAYFGTSANQFYRVRGQGHPMADANWPTFHGGSAAQGRYEQSFSDWLISYGLTIEPSMADRDSDEDGRSDFTEFVQGTIPTWVDAPPSGPEFHQSVPVYGSGGIYSFLLPVGIRAEYRVEKTWNLDAWEAVLLDPQGFEVEKIDDRYWNIRVPFGTDPAGFEALRTRWDWRRADAVPIPSGIVTATPGFVGTAPGDFTPRGPLDSSAWQHRERRDLREQAWPVDRERE